VTAAHHRAFGALVAAGLALSMASGVVAQPVAPQPGGPTAMGDPGSSRLIGRVTDIVTGRPLAGVRVRAGEADGRTDNDGVYRLSLPPGAYRIRVTSPGYQGVTVVERELDPLIGDGEARVDVALPPLVAGASDARKVVDTIRGRAALTATVPVTTTSVEDVGTEDADPQRLAASLAVNEVPATIRVLMPEPPPGSGGHTTLMRMVAGLCEAGHDVTVHTERGPLMRDVSEADAARYVRANFPPSAAAVRLGGDLPPADVAIATGWTTAAAVARAPGIGTRLYFVQDHEPSFQSLSADYAAAARTYRLGLGHISHGHNFYVLHFAVIVQMLLADLPYADDADAGFGGVCHRRVPLVDRVNTFVEDAVIG